jgi:hypothetical protein
MGKSCLIPSHELPTSALLECSLSKSEFNRGGLFLTEQPILIGPFVCTGLVGYVPVWSGVAAWLATQRSIGGEDRCPYVTGGIKEG